MKQDAIKEELIKIIRESCNQPDCIIDEDISFQENLEMSSLDLIMCMTNVEEAFEIKFEPEEFIDIVTIGNLVDLIYKKRKRANNGKRYRP